MLPKQHHPVNIKLAIFSIYTLIHFMSHFSQTLLDFLKSSEPPLTQAELSTRSGVDKTLISRFLTGKKTPSDEQVAKLCAGISNDREDRIRLLVSFLRDMSQPSFKLAGFDNRHVTISSAQDIGQPVRHDQLWIDTAPTGLLTKLTILGKGALLSPSIEALLDAWVNQLGSTSAALDHDGPTPVQLGKMRKMKQLSLESKGLPKSHSKSA